MYSYKQSGCHIYRVTVQVWRTSHRSTVAGGTRGAQAWPLTSSNYNRGSLTSPSVVRYVHQLWKLWQVDSEGWGGDDERQTTNYLANSWCRVRGPPSWIMKYCALVSKLTTFILIKAICFWNSIVKVRESAWNHCPDLACGLTFTPSYNTIAHFHKNKSCKQRNVQRGPIVSWLTKGVLASLVVYPCVLI